MTSYNIEKFLDEADNLYVRNIGDVVETLIHKLGARRLCKEIDVNPASVYSWQTQGIPYRHFEKIKNICLQHSYQIQSKKVRFSIPKSPHAIIFPRYISRELAYLVGYLIGDGTLSTEKRVEFDDCSKDFLIYIASLISRLFDLHDYSLSKDRIHECYCLRLNSGLLWQFFVRVFDIPIGKKKWKLRIPPAIRNSEYLKDFIRGFVDAEGHVYYTPRIGYRISIVQNDNVLFLEEIADALRKKFSIDCSVVRAGERIDIRRKDNVKMFLNEFKLQHPDKIGRAKLLLKGMSTVRKQRISKIKKIILAHLENSRTTSLELSRTLNLRRRTVWYHLRELEMNELAVADRSTFPIRWSASENSKLFQ